VNHVDTLLHFVDEDVHDSTIVNLISLKASELLSHCPTTSNTGWPFPNP
jgi:hypothetical protein